ncbi:MAG: helix-turn-helix domain-containing protein [bacterium]
MLIIDSKRFYEALKKRGYRSVKELAQAIGVHRNTIQHYLSGQGVFPSSLEKVMKALAVEPADILTEKTDNADSPVPAVIANLIDSLHVEFPAVSFVLFGSRTTGKARRYSDWDIGVYSRHGLDHPTYRKIVLRKDDLAENLPYSVDIINLNNADPQFLRAISRSWMWLAGFNQDWLDLQRKAAA